jgi:hypothetical protein
LFKGVYRHGMYNLETMNTYQEIPSFDEQFTELNQFICTLVDNYHAGKINSWDDLEQRVNAFFTPERMEQMESCIPGWQKMSSYNDGITLVHVMCVFLGLLMMPEYTSMTPYQQNLMKWVVLFHDIKKVVEKGKRDPKHGFRSAVTAAQRLPTLGFTTTPEYNDLIDTWSEFTYSAVTMPEGTLEPVQDNGKLRAILSGIDRLFGKDSPAACIVKTILLHMSITVVSEWPQAAPLSPAEVAEYVDSDVRPLLQCMMLADNEGWVMFYPEDRAKQREETLKTFNSL